MPELHNITIKFTVTFNATPWPDDESDDLESRVRALIQISIRAIQELRRVAVNPIGGYWLPFEHSNWKSLTTDADVREALKSSQTGLIQCAIGDEQWILMESGLEIVGRLIPTPTPLEYTDEGHRGTAAERAVRHSARWGLIDFVFRPHDYHKGQALTRELNDAALISGEYGLAIQVKSKRPESDSEHEAGRVATLVAQAASQAAGSVRELLQSIRELTNDRGRKVPVDGCKIGWIGVVIIDHDDPPEMEAFVYEVRGLSIVALFREEWEFLFEQLCSTTLVICYIHAISAAGVIPGNHVAYYYRQAERARLRNEAVDCTRAITELDPVWLPLEPASTIDMRGGRMFRQILEDVACGDSPMGTEEDRLTVLSLLDGLPAEERSQTGRLLINLLEEALLNAGNFHCRRYFFPSRGIQLCFVVSSASTAHDLFSARSQLWHIEWLRKNTHLHANTPYTVSLLFTPQRHEYRPWATLMMGLKGSLNYTDEEVADLRRAGEQGIDGSQAAFK